MAPRGHGHFGGHGGHGARPAGPTGFFGRWSPTKSMYQIGSFVWAPYRNKMFTAKVLKVYSASISSSGSSISEEDMSYEVEFEDEDVMYFAMLFCWKQVKYLHDVVYTG